MLFRPSPDDGWGKLWGTLAQTTVAEQAGCSLRFQYHILWDFTPKEALVFTFLLCVLLTLMTGLFLYLCSICGIKHIGCGILSALILLTMIVDWMNATTFNWLSPYSWICLDTTMRQYNGSLPSIGYVFCLLGIINSILLIGIFVRTKCSREALIS